MHIRCPHCHHPIEVVEEYALQDLSCPTCGSHFSLVPDATTTFQDAGPRQIAHFDLLEILGNGAFGSVWKCRDKELDRLVAVKVPRKDQLSPGEEESFFREARAAAQLNHPHIVKVHEVGRDQDQIFIASELIEGITLADWITAKSLTPEESVTICVKVAQALEHAHQKGVVHRDLKPSNILLNQELEPFITDFGLAKRESSEITMTVDGKLLGTPAYMSPEQAAGEAHTADRRSDVYSLGVILFELLTGERPFRGNTRMLIHQVLNEEPPSLRKLNNRVPRDLETICLKAMAKLSSRRYQSADAMAADLQHWQRNEPISARPAGMLERSWRMCQRRPLVTGLTAMVFGLLAVTAVVFGVSNWRIQQEMATAAQERQFAIESLIEALMIAKPEAVPKIIEKLHPLSQRVLPLLELRMRDERTSPAERLHVACALSQLGISQAQYLVSTIPSAGPEDCCNIADSLQLENDSLGDRLLAHMDASEDDEHRIRLAAVLGQMGDGRGWDRLLSSDADRNVRTQFLHTLNAWYSDWEDLPQVYSTLTNPASKAAVCSAIGLLDPSNTTEMQRTSLFGFLEREFTETNSPGIHSAAGWSLRKWQRPEPKLSRTRAAEDDRQWFVNNSGITMLLVPASESPTSSPLLESFYLSDREIPVSLFEEFIQDEDYPAHEKPADYLDWRGVDDSADEEHWGPNPARAGSPECPIHNVSVYDAMLFCNWLSRREDRAVCYSQAKHKWSMSVGDGSQFTEVDGWECNFSANGYRLPTIWEWRHAAGAQAFPYHFGSDRKWLADYAWYSDNSQQRSWPTGSKMPSLWGFFDAFGSLNEHLWHRQPDSGWFGLGGGDYLQPAAHCSLATLFQSSPATRSVKNGFRIVCAAPDSREPFESALEAVERTALSQATPSVATITGLIRNYEIQGDRAGDSGRREEALDWYSRCIVQMEGLPDDQRPGAGIASNLADLRHKRAEIYRRLELHAEALRDWTQSFVEADPSSQRLREHLLKAAWRASAEAMAASDAAKAAADVCHVSQSDPNLLLLAARVYARCTQTAEMAGETEQANQWRQAGKQAIEAARQAGFEDMQSLESNSDFAPLLNPRETSTEAASEDEE